MLCSLTRRVFGARLGDPRIKGGGGEDDVHNPCIHGLIHELHEVTQEFGTAQFQWSLHRK